MPLQAARSPLPAPAARLGFGVAAGTLQGSGDPCWPPKPEQEHCVVVPQLGAGPWGMRSSSLGTPTPSLSFLQFYPPACMYLYRSRNRVYRSRKRVYRSRNRVYTSRNRVYRSRNWVYTSRNRVYTSRISVSVLVFFFAPSHLASTSHWGAVPVPSSCRIFPPEFSSELWGCRRNPAMAPGRLVGWGSCAPSPRGTQHRAASPHPAPGTHSAAGHPSVFCTRAQAFPKNTPIPIPILLTPLQNREAGNQGGDPRRAGRRVGLRAPSPPTPKKFLPKLGGRD